MIEASKLRSQLPVLGHATCKRHRASWDEAWCKAQQLRVISKRKWQRNGKKWQVVAQRFLICCLVVWLIICLVDRRLSPRCVCLVSGRLTFRSCLASSLIVAYSSQSVNVQLNFNNIVTCTLPNRAHRAQQPTTPTQRRPPPVQPLLVLPSVCIPPQSPRFSLSARIYTFVRPLCLRCSDHES